MNSQRRDARDTHPLNLASIQTLSNKSILLCADHGVNAPNQTVSDSSSQFTPDSNSAQSPYDDDSSRYAEDSVVEMNRSNSVAAELQTDCGSPYASLPNGHLSMARKPTTTADHFVNRAYNAIINAKSLPWIWSGVSSSTSELPMARDCEFDNPGCRLIALRSNLRKEQHMSVAIDRVAAVLLVSLRHDLGESYHGPREKGYRPTIMGNKLLGDQWQKSRKEVIEEIRGALAYYFAEELISPGINLLLGSRSQDM